MELTAAQRKMAFAVVVFVLAGLGLYLVTTARHGSGSPAATSHGPAGQGSPAGQGGGRSAGPRTPAASPTAPQSGPASPTSSSHGATPNIYQWLPFTPAGLSSAAAVAVKFGAAYGTYSYTQSAAAYVGTMRNLITPDLSQQISAAYSTPGVAALRTRRKQVSAGNATITSLRAFGPTSLTFIVSVTERVIATQDGGQLTTSYAVTVTGGDTSWQVNTVELASEGNS
jgi:hypothetical protein